MSRFRDWLSNGVIEEIRTKCRPFLDETDQPLYRGIWMMDAARLMGGKEIQVRKDRKPRDSDPHASKLMDDWFEKHYGIRPRGQGLFCSGKVGEAKVYGTPTYVFPVGNFKYIWGVEAQDRDPLRDSLVLSNTIIDRMKVRPAAEAPQIVDEIMNKVDWYNDALEDAQDTNAEIVVVVDSAIMVPVREYADYSELLRAIYGSGAPDSASTSK